MATNKILGFGTTAGTEYDDTTYAGLAARTLGNQPGIADPLLVNKVLHQTSAIAAGFAQWLANKQGTDLVDTLTPSALATMIAGVVGGTASLAANGSLILPSGLILQWGTASTSASADVAVSFPIAFPTACRGVYATENNSSTNGAWAATNSRTTSGFNISGWTTASARTAFTADWFAVGY